MINNMKQEGTAVLLSIMNILMRYAWLFLWEDKDRMNGVEATWTANKT